MRKFIGFICVLGNLLLAACATQPVKEQEAAMSSSVADKSNENPFFSISTWPYQLPPFDQIRNEHFKPAFERGMAEQLGEVERIVSQDEPATFENTLVPLERSGAILGRTERVFFALISAHTHEELEAVRSEMAPRLSAHADSILLNPKLFERIEAVYQNRKELNLDPESERLLELSHRDFVRAGARLKAADQERLKTTNAELASLSTQFSQNVLDEVNELALVLDSSELLAGLSDEEKLGAAEEAKKRDLPGKYVVALLNTSGQPALSALQNRGVREQLHRRSLSRGSRGGTFDNRAVLTKTVKLRAERARLLGYPNHASYVLEVQTARSPDAVNERLSLLAPAAVSNAQQELKALEEMARKDGVQDFSSWDWAYYSEQVRKARYDFDETQLRPYFSLDRVLRDGVFFAASRLYGLSFQERTDLPTYHPDVRVFEVFEADGEPLALFLFDPFARPTKRGGAWMNAYVLQSELLHTKPVVANHLNIPKPPEGQVPLLTFDEVTTLFHEFGHALHGMFSNVRYPQLSGTQVPRDFVEFPSQVNEMWAVWPEVLQNYAKHYESGAPMPTALLEKVLATQTFNQGFATTEYLAASLLDQAWHQLDADNVPVANDVLAFESAALQKHGVGLEQVPPRYRSTYFSHIMGGYSAGYYSYIWSEVLDADTVEWFRENGGLRRENGQHFRDALLSRGGTQEATELYEKFRGRSPQIAPLLKRRGLVLPQTANKK